MEQAIVVSIAVITYNQENYIREAIESILMQKVNFKYEIVVGEDCSQDRTREVLLEYKEKYPKLFKLILRDENIGATKNSLDVLQNCSGKFIALLEGDDFWTDQNKLQKQVDFLESNNKYIGAAHNYEFVDRNGRVQSFPKNLKRFYDKDFTLKDFNKGTWPIHTATLLFRNIFHADTNMDYSILYTAHNIRGDGTLLWILLDQADIFVMRQVMSAYRCITEPKGTNFVSTYSSISQKDKVIDQLQYYERLDKCLLFKRKLNFNAEKARWVAYLIIYTIRRHRIKDIEEMFFVFKMINFKVIILALLYTSQVVLTQPFRKIKRYFAD